MTATKKHPKLVAELLELLERALPYVSNCEDVVDGPEGEQRPNEAMYLAAEIKTVLEDCE